MYRVVGGNAIDSRGCDDIIDRVTFLGRVKDSKISNQGRINYEGIVETARESHLLTRDQRLGEVG